MAKRLLHMVFSAMVLTSAAWAPVSAADGDPPAEEHAPHADRGLYAIWARPAEQDLPWIRGGQICLQWAGVEPRRGEFDFSALDEQLARWDASGRKVTVQINGNRRPDWMFDCVPHCPENLSSQVADKQGTLQYWHPNHLAAYLELLAAYGKHLRESPHRRAVLGVRLNFNAIGTEHFTVPKPYRTAEGWTHPPGVPPAEPWSRDVEEAYKRRVIDAFIEHFTPQVWVFVRNNVVLDQQPNPDLMRRFETGQLGLFHTSSEIEPRGAGTEKRYQAFIDYCRSGKTLAYAESWADAWGRHGGKTDERWCSPAQWNYWRLLVDLHCGVSFIAVYGNDLKHADDPEFKAAFEFASRYAGYHASGSVSPGAWVAFRQGDFLQGDYNFLMKRLDGDRSQPLRNAGPEQQRYGAWARRFLAGSTARFALDRSFAASLQGKPVAVRVVYLDLPETDFSVSVSGQVFRPRASGSGRWQQVEFDVPRAAFDLAAESQLSLHCKRDTTLQMVELRRPDAR